jgi:hypothetical protein
MELSLKKFLFFLFDWENPFKWAYVLAEKHRDLFLGFFFENEIEAWLYLIAQNEINKFFLIQMTKVLK